MGKTVLKSSPLKPVSQYSWMEVVVAATILKVYYPKTIHAMFALNWLTGFRGEDF
jgi:hypothetical protein